MQKLISLLLAAGIGLSGCSAFRAKTQVVSATCSEQDAVLQINDRMFRGSGQAAVQRNKGVLVTCLKPGFFPAQKYIEHSMSYAGMADFIGTLLIIAPVYGLFTPGAYDLDETSVNLPMIPALTQYTSSSKPGVSRVKKR